MGAIEPFVPDHEDEFETMREIYENEQEIEENQEEEITENIQNTKVLSSKSGICFLRSITLCLDPWSIGRSEYASTEIQEEVDYSSRTKWKQCY